MTERGQRIRMLIVVAVFTAVWLGLGSRLCMLHLGGNERWRARIEANRGFDQKLHVGRGRIFDRNGDIMALDVVMKNVAVDPQEMRRKGNPLFSARQLARLLEIDPAIVFARVAQTNQYGMVKTFVPEEVTRDIQRMGLPGVLLDDVSVRTYPRGALMSHVVGFANVEGIGSAGIEQRLDRYLRGIQGWRISQKDGHRREVYTRRELDIDPRSGGDVHLTLDQNLQYFVEKALDDAMATNGAKAAWAVVQHVRTGEILAMASRPTYDLNQFNEATEESRRNRNIGMVFEPGSIFKVIVYAAALNEGLLEPGEIIDCENGLWHYAGKPLSDYHPYGRLTAENALRKSSNIAAAKIALRLGDQKLYDYMRAFGIGLPTGISLPGEEVGLLAEPRRWTKLSITRIPMGHEVAVTSMQMLNALSTIANGGARMRPLVIRRVTTSAGKTLIAPQPEEIGRAIRPETARMMAKLLTGVTIDGTGTKAKVDGYHVAGKTGTAEKLVNGRYDPKSNLSSFIGFLPAEEPEISILVSFDEPQGPKPTGGKIAAPVFRAIAEQAVRYLDIPPLPAERMFAIAGEHENGESH